MLAGSRATHAGEVMRTTVTVLVALATATPALAAPPEVAPPPPVLLALADEIDLATVDTEEETLEALNQVEIDASSWSMGTAIGLSLIPGGGWGLFYAEKPGAAWLTTTLAAVGYGIGAAYALGAFDESTRLRCRFDDSQSVPLENCRAAHQNDHPWNKEKDEEYSGRRFFQAKDQYSFVTTGEDFDGTVTGLAIIGGTYVVTTLLGAVWSGTAVHRHNDAVRKRVESTASVRPILGYTGRQGVLGLGVDF